MESLIKFLIWKNKVKKKTLKTFVSVRLISVFQLIYSSKLNGVYADLATIQSNQLQRALEFGELNASWKWLDPILPQNELNFAVHVFVVDGFALLKVDTATHLEVEKLSFPVWDPVKLKHMGNQQI